MRSTNSIDPPIFAGYGEVRDVQRAGSSHLTEAVEREVIGLHNIDPDHPNRPESCALHLSPESPLHNSYFPFPQHQQHHCRSAELPIR
ncbi:hypothetical protein VTN31DRAFT_3520 [Thermomyces dupontii]|uniref:uncharacterized protein n=1 Tax=Talaromyces thermophilus TaxID=28565 RepID=UPI003742527A